MTPALSNTPDRNIWGELASPSFLALGIILAIGAFLRLYRLSETPDWVVDEFVHLELARNLLDGEARVGALRVDWFGPIAHPPLFFLLGALSLGLFGDSIGALRAVTATAGITSIVLLYSAGCLLRGRGLGLLAAAAHAVMPMTVMLDRRAYAYPLVLPLALGLCLALMHFRRRRRRRSLYAAAGLVSCLLVTGHYTAPLLAVLGAFVLIHDRSRALHYLALSLTLPLLAFAVFTLPRLEPALFTLGWELERASLHAGSVRALLEGSLQLIRQDELLILSVLGLASLRAPGAPWLGAVFVAVSGFLLYRRPEIAAVYYPSGAFLGFFALPFAGLFLHLRDLGLATVRTGAARAAVLTATLGIPALLLGAKLAMLAPAVWSGRLEAPSSPKTDRSAELRAAQAFLASVVRPGDLVASNYTVSHALPVRRTDLMQIYAYETGRGTPFYPDYLPDLPGYREQVFAFDCSLARVDYLVLSRLDWRWTLQQPFARELLGVGARELHAEWMRQHHQGQPDMTLTLRGEGWRVLHRAGDVMVLRRPARPSS